MLLNGRGVPLNRLHVYKYHSSNDYTVICNIHYIIMWKNVVCMEFLFISYTNDIILGGFKAHRTQ